MTKGEFSLIEAFTTRSGTHYRVFFDPKEGDARPSGAFIVPQAASLTLQGVQVKGSVYGRESEGVKPDGSPRVPDGAQVTTTPVTEVILRNPLLESFLRMPQAEILRSIRSLRSVRGTEYPFIRGAFEVAGNPDRKLFLPRKLSIVDGCLFATGQLWGSVRCRAGEEVELSNIGSLVLRDGSVLNTRRRVELAPSPVCANPAPVLS